jgi:hypothetical protein
MIMEKVIAYPSNGSIGIIYPVNDCGIPFEEICRKDVPDGTPYKILDKASLPNENYVFRDAWEVDFSNPDGYGIGQQKWFIEQATKELLAIENEQPPENSELIDGWEKSKARRIEKCNQIIALQTSELKAGI